MSDEKGSAEFWEMFYLLDSLNVFAKEFVDDRGRIEGGLRRFSVAKQFRKRIRVELDEIAKAEGVYGHIDSAIAVLRALVAFARDESQHTLDYLRSLESEGRKVSPKVIEYFESVFTTFDKHLSSCKPDQELSKAA